MQTAHAGILEPYAEPPVFRRRGGLLVLGARAVTV